MKKNRIDNNNNLISNFEYEDISLLGSDFENVAVVCFENNYSNENYYIKLLNEDWTKKVILIGAKPTSCFGNKLIITKLLKESYFKDCDRIFFMIDTDVDEDVLKPLVQIYDIANKKGIGVGANNILGFTNFLNKNLEKTLEALVQENDYKKYEIVYDYLCDELDKKFADNSICQFENDRCIVNRKYYDRSKIMGCCYSFKYNGIRFSDIRLCEHQKDKKCDVKCLGCKLFTCGYLKEHGIRFSLENMPIALAFFDKKQRETLRITFFTSKENVINKIIR